MHPIFITAALRSFGLSSPVLLLALSACGGGDANGTAREGSSASAGEQTAASSPAPVSSSVPFELKISQGPFAGTHHMTDNVNCTAEPGTWMVTSGRPGTQGITQVLMTLEGVPVAGGSSQELAFMATFGDPMDDSNPNSGTMSFGQGVGEGTGTGTVRRNGRSAVIEVVGTTGDGADVSVAVRCATVAGVA